MPSTSKTQQRLMGVAYAVKSGSMQLSDVDAAYRDKVEELVDGMTLKQLKDFASTEHDGLPEKVKEDLAAVTPNMLGGMGNVSLPDLSTGAVGSGDVPAGQGNAKAKKKRKIKFKLLNMDQFMQESKGFQPEAEDEKLGQKDYEKGSKPDPDTEMETRMKQKQTIRSTVGVGLLGFRDYVSRN